MDGGAKLFSTSWVDNHTLFQILVKKRGKRHNRVHPGHFATQQGTPFYPAGMSQWSSCTSRLGATLDKKEYPVVSQNDLGAPCCVVSPNMFVYNFFTTNQPTGGFEFSRSKLLRT